MSPRKQKLLEIIRDNHLAQNPDAAMRDFAETQLLGPVLEKLMAGIKYVAPIKGKDYFTPAEVAMFYSALYQELRANIKDGARGPMGPQGVAGRDGPRGDKGADGFTPKRGVDYFTPADIDMIVRRVLAQVPNPEPINFGAAVTPHLEEFKKNLPTNDSVLVSILKDPRLRMLLHGGASTSSSSSGVSFEAPTGTVNGVNMTFTVLNTPKYVIYDSATYFDGHGYSLSGLTVTTDVAPTSFIRSAY